MPKFLIRQIAIAYALVEVTQQELDTAIAGAKPDDVAHVRYAYLLDKGGDVMDGHYASEVTPVSDACTTETGDPEIAALDTWAQWEYVGREVKPERAQ